MSRYFWYHLLMPCLGFLHVLMADTGLQSFLYFPCLILVLGYIRNHQAYRLSPLKDPAKDINITCKFDRPHLKNIVWFLMILGHWYLWNAMVWKFVSPQNTCWNPTPKVMLLGGGALGGISHEATSLMNRSVPLKKEALRDPSPWGHGEKAPEIRGF